MNNSNNPFAIHGISHLSPSNINAYVSDKPKWIMTYLFDIRDQFGVGATRGNAIESSLHEYLKDKNLSAKNVKEKFIEMCTEEHHDIEDEKTIKELNKLPQYYNQFQKFAQTEGYDELENYQEKIELQLLDLPVPIIGYIDFNFRDIIVDLKTVSIIPKTPSHAHCRQMAIYSMIYPEKHIELFYMSSKDCRIFRLSIETLDYYKKQVETIAFNIQKFLSRSNDKNILATDEEYPNFDKWEWSDFMKKEATNIWRI